MLMKKNTDIFIIVVYIIVGRRETVGGSNTWKEVWVGRKKLHHGVLYLKGQCHEIFDPRFFSSSMALKFDLLIQRYAILIQRYAA
jgi:hypothetical protein